MCTYNANTQGGTCDALSLDRRQPVTKLDTSINESSTPQHFGSQMADTIGTPDYPKCITVNHIASVKAVTLRHTPLYKKAQIRLNKTSNPIEYFVQ